MGADESTKAPASASPAVPLARANKGSCLSPDRPHPRRSTPHAHRVDAYSEVRLRLPSNRRRLRCRRVRSPQLPHTDGPEAHEQEKGRADQERRILEEADYAEDADRHQQPEPEGDDGRSVESDGDHAETDDEQREDHGDRDDDGRVRQRVVDVCIVFVSRFELEPAT